MTVQKRLAARRPLPTPDPEPAVQAEDRPDPEPVQVPAAPQPVAAPVAIRYNCSFCQTPMPLAELRQVADSMQCSDARACLARAAARELYPQVADEQKLAAFELRQGVPA